MYILDTDGSHYSIGAVLSQIQNGEEKVLTYYSQVMSKEERNYCVTRKELLAIIKSIKHFHHYLYVQHVKVRTDHGSLTCLLNFKNPEGQLARWLEVLGTYDMKIEFRPGRYHSNGDGLSRIPCDHCSYCSRQEDRHLKAIRAIKISDTPTPAAAVTNPNVLPSHKQLLDEDIGPIFTALEAKQPKFTDEEVQNKGPVFRKYWHQWDRLTVQQGVLYRQWFKNEKNVTLQLIVPTELKVSVLQGLHDDRVASYMGINYKENDEKSYGKVLLVRISHGCCQLV